MFGRGQSRIGVILEPEHSSTPEGDLNSDVEAIIMMSVIILEMPSIVPDYSMFRSAVEEVNKTSPPYARISREVSPIPPSGAAFLLIAWSR